LPQDLPTCTSTHTEAVHNQGPLGRLPSLSSTNKGSLLHLGSPSLSWTLLSSVSHAGRNICL